jgi:hypothetical protein
MLSYHLRQNTLCSAAFQTASGQPPGRDARATNGSERTGNSRGKRQRRVSEAQPSENGRAQRGQAALAKPFPKEGGAAKSIGD